MRFTDFRLKIRHLFRKYKRIFFVILSIWGIVIFVNYMLKGQIKPPQRTTTYEPHVSVMSETSTTPKKLQVPIENMIKEYVKACNTQDYEKAYFMLSEECREYQFNNSPAEFVKYVLTKLPNKRNYNVQNYSNFTVQDKKIYMYEVRYTEDILATGLTGTEYVYTSDQMAFQEDADGNVKMAVGSYIYQTPIQSIAENEYLKIDVLNKIVKYAQEDYEVKFTNRSENTVVIANGYGADESELQLLNERRKRIQVGEIVLEPGESTTKIISFQRFVDDGDSSNALIFGAIRVMEKYSGTDGIAEEIILKEMEEALAKFSFTVSVKGR